MEAILSILDLWVTDCWLIRDLIEKRSKRKEARRRIRQWLDQLTVIQRELLEMCMCAVGGSKRRTFELPSERIAPAFEAECALVLDLGGILRGKYPTPGMRSYRFEPWLYDYLTGRPELIGMDYPPMNSAVVLHDFFGDRGAGSQLLKCRDLVGELEDAYRDFCAAVNEAVEGGSIEAIEASDLALSRLYLAHGSPFGQTATGKIMWNSFEVWTTSN